MRNKRVEAETIFKIGDRVRLKAGAGRVEVNDFERMREPFFFEAEDVGTVFTVDSPRLRVKQGFPDVQTVVRFEKMSKKRVLAQLVARVETKDLELVR